MFLESTRFGRVEIPDDAVVDFPNGLIGLGGRRYALLAPSQGSPFIWLHSLDDPALALPLTSPWRFFAAYEVVLSEPDAARVGIGGRGDELASVYVTLRAAENAEDVTANLRAPILIVDDVGHQIVNQIEDAPIRARLLDGICVDWGSLAA